jgi:hypothetical protein
VRGVKTRGLFCAYDVVNLTADGVRVGRAGLTRCKRRPGCPHYHVVLEAVLSLHQLFQAKRSKSLSPTSIPVSNEDVFQVCCSDSDLELPIVTDNNGSIQSTEDVIASSSEISKSLSPTSIPVSNEDVFQVCCSDSDLIKLNKFHSMKGHDTRHKTRRDQTTITFS